MLPPYDAPKKRAATKTGDLAAANGGTPLSSHSHARSTLKTGVAASHHACHVKVQLHFVIFSAGDTTDQNLCWSFLETSAMSDQR